MLNVFSRLFLGMVLVSLVLMGHPAIAQAQAHPAPSHPAQLAKAVEEIENLDALRSGLASYLKDASEPPTAATMKQVCKPVGMQAMALSQENGWQVKQIAAKYRNPAHGPDTDQARAALTKFRQNPELMGFWEPSAIHDQSGNDQSGTRYYRRINVEASCLACHGAKGDRPQFVKDNYPHDLAYDFSVGDLRGMYAVFMPDIQQALKEAR